SGVVLATFTRGTWSIVDPVGAVSTVDLGVLEPTNNRTYVDVLFHPNVGGTLDASTIEDAADEFTLSATGITIGATPLSLGGGRYRYFLSGADFSTGLVTVSFG